MRFIPKDFLTKKKSGLIRIISLIYLEIMIDALPTVNISSGNIPCGLPCEFKSIASCNYCRTFRRNGANGQLPLDSNRLTAVSALYNELASFFNSRIDARLSFNETFVCLRGLFVLFIKEKYVA